MAAALRLGRLLRPERAVEEPAAACRLSCLGCPWPALRLGRAGSGVERVASDEDRPDGNRQQAQPER